MTTLESTTDFSHAPRAYIDRIIRGAQNEVNEGVTPQQSFKALVETLSKEGCPYSILHDPVLQCPTAISYHDPDLIRTQPDQCVVFTSDVTFGLSDVNSGFHKWSFFSQITEGTRYSFSMFVQYIRIILLIYCRLFIAVGTLPPMTQQKKKISYIFIFYYYRSCYRNIGNYRFD